MYNKIPVPLDGPPLAEAVLPHIQALATTAEDQFILLRVSVDPAAEFAFSDPSLACELIDNLEAESLTYLQSIRARLQKAGLRTIFLIRQGAVAETILHVAGEVQADVVAMSTHGRSGVSRPTGWSTSHSSLYYSFVRSRIRLRIFHSGRGRPLEIWPAEVVEEVVAYQE